jgi:hypothetical protein
MFLCRFAWQWELLRVTANAAIYCRLAASLGLGWRDTGRHLRSADVPVSL